MDISIYSGSTKHKPLAQEVKPVDKWSTYIKIEEKDSYANIKNRFCICDYGGLKKRATKRGIMKTNITIGIKDKRINMSS